MHADVSTRMESRDDLALLGEHAPVVAVHFHARLCRSTHALMQFRGMSRSRASLDPSSWKKRAQPTDPCGHAHALTLFGPRYILLHTPFAGMLRAAARNQGLLHI